MKAIIMNKTKERYRVHPEDIPENVKDVAYGKEFPYGTIINYIKYLRRNNKDVPHYVTYKNVTVKIEKVDNKGAIVFYFIVIIIFLLLVVRAMN
jgi:hypothetical protein